MSSADDFFAGGTPSAKFDTIGKTIAGAIVRVGDPVQQRDFTTGEPKSWPDGRPMMQLPVDVQTDERDPQTPDDNGVRAIYIRGNMQKAVRDALRKTKAPGLRVGGHLSVSYIGDDTPKQRGMNGAKLYSASYTPPAPAGADEFTGGSASVETPAVDVPAQAPAGVDAAALAAAMANMTPEQLRSLGITAA